MFIYQKFKSMIRNIQGYLSTFNYKNITPVPVLTQKISLEDSSELNYKNAGQLHIPFFKMYQGKTWENSNVKYVKFQECG